MIEVKNLVKRTGISRSQRCGEIHDDEYYSYKIDIIPKTEYNVLEGEVYSLCI